MIAAMAIAVRHRHQTRARTRAAGVTLLAAIASLLGASAAGAQLQPGSQAETAPGELLVQFDSGTGGSARADVRDAAGTSVDHALREPGLQLLRVDRGTSVQEAIQRLEASSRVRFAQPNFVYHATAVGPDPDLGQQWELPTIGVPQAWTVTHGSPSVTVAVVDSGIADDHPDLHDNVDTSRGRDFFDDSTGFDPVGDPRDLNGHGSHVAGTIAAEGNNGIGVAGMTWNSTLVSVRVLDGHGAGASDELAEGLDYAGDIGAKVANVSISGSGSDPAVAAAIRSHPNTLYVAAAGNDSSDNDATPQSPCNVDALNLICVAATTQADRLAAFSNYGRASVDLGAPGEQILSTEPARTVLAGKSWAFDAALTGWDLEGWASTTAKFKSPGYSATDSPLGDYPLNSTTRMTTHDPLDFTGRRGCAAGYQLNLDTERALPGAPAGDRGDLLRVMTNNHGGSVYWEQDTWLGSTGGMFKPLRTFLDSDGRQVKLRYQLLGNSDAAVGDGAYVDDVSVGCFSGAGVGDYVKLDGTSMAAPHVTGVAALIWAARPNASVASVRCDILGTGAALGDLASTTVTGRRLDAAAAVSGARSAVPPAETGEVDGVSSTGATLLGVADPCATASTYQIEIGTTTAYGGLVPSAPAALGAGSGPVSVSQPVGGLAPSTTYHYRLVTIRDGVSLPGADRTFTTAPAPAPANPVTPSIPRVLTLRDVKVSCKRSGSGRRRTVACTLRQAAAVHRLSARLTLRGRLYARASGKPPQTGRLKLKPVRRLRGGRYRLTLTLRDAKGAKRTKTLTVKV
jgi:thermitase